MIAAEPENAPLLGSGIGQDYNADGSPAASHPAFRPHPMQGWTPDFIPKLAGDAVTSGHIDAMQAVRGDDAIHCARDLARKEGLLVGITAGATLAAALKVAQTAPKGARILAMLPDTGERYLSTPLFDGIEVEMDADELAIAASTPRFRFDTGVVQTAPAVTGPVKLDAEAVAAVDAILADQDQPVVIFALEWCEFAWGVKRLMAELGVPFRAVHLDGPEFVGCPLGDQGPPRHVRPCRCRHDPAGLCRRSPCGRRDRDPRWPATTAASRLCLQLSGSMPIPKVSATPTVSCPDGCTREGRQDYAATKPPERVWRPQR